MEDRLESMIRHSGKWNYKPDEFVSFEKKLKKVKKLAEEKKSPANRYFPVELTDRLEAWKESRNSLIHALMKQALCAGDLSAVADEGRILVKTLCSKTTSYNRMLSKLNDKKEA